MALPEDVKKDMAGMLMFSAQHNIKNPQVAEKIINHALSKNMMGSSIGQEYINRLNDISGGAPISECTCMFCRMNISDDGVICHECMEKYSQGKYKIYEDSREDRKPKSGDEADSEISAGDSGDSSEEGTLGIQKVLKETDSKKAGSKQVGSKKTEYQEEGSKDTDSKGIGSKLSVPVLKAIATIIAGIIVVFAIGVAAGYLFSQKQVKTDRMSKDSIADNSFADEYRSSLLKYLEEIGLSTDISNVEVIYDDKVVSDNSESAQYADRYLIRVNGENEGGLYIKMDSDNISSIIIVSPMEAEGTSILMIPAVKCVNPGITSGQAADIIIEAINNFNNDQTEGNEKPTAYKVGNYMYIYGNYDGVYMLRIETVNDTNS